MLRFVQHDSRVVIPNTLFCHSERMRGIQYGCFTSLSMTRPKMSFRASVRNPAHGCFASLSMTAVWSFRTLFFVIPSACEESIAWMLHFVQHDKSGKCGCFASLSMTRPKMSFRTLFFVIPSVSEESIAWMLHCAQHDRPMSFRTLFFVII